MSWSLPAADMNMQGIIVFDPSARSKARRTCTGLQLPAIGAKKSLDLVIESLNPMTKRGFTLVETLLVLSLVGLLAVLAGSLYRYFERIQIGEVRHIRELQQTQFFDMQVQQDMDRSCRFQYEASLLQLYSCRAEPWAQYRFASDHVLRQVGEQRDTFHVQVRYLSERSHPPTLLGIRVSQQGQELFFESLPFSRVHESAEN